MDGRRIDDEWMTNGRHWTTMDDDCHDDCHLTNKDVLNNYDGLNEKLNNDNGYDDDDD